MSTVHLVRSDISSLASEARRRNTDVKSACENSLAVLNRLDPLQDLSSPQIGLLNDEKDIIVRPFLISIVGGNVKFATISIPVLHRLISGHVVVPELLPTLLHNLKEASHLGADIQLRILQCLPSIMQSYGESIHGDLLMYILTICTGLSTNNKSTVVINTALATLQQLFRFIFDSIKNDKLQQSQVELDHELVLENDQKCPVSSISYEGYMILSDLTILALGDRKVTFLSENIYLRDISVLELLEQIIGSQGLLFKQCPEFSFLLRLKIIPALLRILNDKTKPYILFVRVLRIIQVILLNQIENAEVECEVILSFFIHSLNEKSNKLDRVPGLNDVGSVSESEIIEWEQILMLEVLKSIFHDFNVIRIIFEKYDQKPETTNILQSLLITLNQYYQKFLPPLSECLESENSSNPLQISKSKSSVKIAFIDHLDKLEPSIPPKTYSSYLILNIILSFLEGVAKFVATLSSNSSSKTLESNVHFVSSLIESSYPDVSHLLQMFLYSPMDNETFHLFIRSLQKYTHTCGLLGLESLRDLLFILICKAIINNSSKKDSPESPGAILKNLYALGEQLMESLGATGGSDELTPSLPSQFNTRHVTCVRAIVNLAISLGSTLDKSWKIIWIALQWCDFYTNGPDEFSIVRKNANEEKTANLNQSSLTVITNSNKKLLASIQEYEEESYLNLLVALTELSNVSLNGSQNQDDKLYFEPCPYNKMYFLNIITELCQLDTNKYLLESNASIANNNKTSKNTSLKINKIWKVARDFYIETVLNRSLHQKVRFYAVEQYNSIISSISEAGFSAESTQFKTAIVTLDALQSLIARLLNLKKPEELLVANVELDIHLATLQSLHTLIDKYDKYFSNSYETVFEILNTPFKIELDSNPERLASIYETAISTLKLILDEFLVSLPYDQLKILIDTLYNFATHKTNLNYSFSAVSYFWLASDTIKTRINNSERVPLENQPKNEEQLLAFLANPHQEDATSYEILEIYLLLTVSKIAEDSRPHLRNDAILTFFSVLDVYGRLLQSWKLVYDVIFTKILSFDVNVDEPGTNKQEWILSLENTLKGLVWFYSTFMSTLDDQIALEYWQGLIKYFTQLVNLKWVNLNMIVFSSFKECLESVEKYESTQSAPKTEVNRLFFNFWIKVPVEIDFVNPRYQESLVQLMQCFPPLFRLSKDVITPEDASSTFNNFVSCARYPILQDGYKDSSKPSKLQAAVLDNFAQFKQLKNNPEIEANSILQLSNILVFPFSTRERIEQKLAGTITGKFKTPTFIGLSTLALEEIKQITELLGTVVDILMSNKGILKLLRSLLEVVQKKFMGVEGNESPQWIKANLVLRNLIGQILSKENSIDNELWSLILSAVELSVSSKDVKDEPYEDENIKQYYAVSELIVPKFSTLASDNLIKDFVIELFEKSFLYQPNDYEKDLLLLSSEDLLKELTDFDFDLSFINSSSLIVYNCAKIATTCLGEVIKFASENTDSSLRAHSIDVFLKRLAITLFRMISDLSLLNHAPLPLVQRKDAGIILEGVIHIRKRLNKSDLASLVLLRPLVEKLVPYCGKIQFEQLVYETIDSLA